MEISKLTNEILKVVGELKTQVELYNNLLISKKIDGKYPNDFQKFQELIKNISLDKKPLGDFDKSVKYASQILSIMDNIKQMKRIYETFQEYFDEEISKDISSTLFEIASESAAINFDDFISSVNNLIADLLPQVFPEGTKLSWDIIKKVENKTIMIYLTKMMIRCDKNILDNPDFFIEIESLKERVLGERIPREDVDIFIQNSIQTLGLVPVGLSLELKEFLKKYFKITGKVSWEDLPKLISKKGDIGVILITNVFPLPKEINMWNIIDTESLVKRELILPPTIGLNAKILERFEVINKLDQVDEKISKIEKFNDSAEFFYVIETLDGKHYRLLQFVTPLIQKDFINKYGNREVCPSNKIEMYNRIFQEELMKQLEEPFIDQQSLGNIRTDRDKLQVFRRKIKDVLMKHFEKSLGFIKNDQDLISQLSSPVVFNLIFSSIFNMISIDSPYLFSDINSELNDEIKISFIKDLVNYTEKFNRYSVKDYKENFSKMMRDNWGRNKNEQLMRVLDKLLDGVIPAIFTDKSNIYKSLIQKSRIIEAIKRKLT